MRTHPIRCILNLNQAQQSTNPLDPNPFRYCGEYIDGESGQVYLRNRYYDPGTGRFTSEDPIRSGANWYAYCGGNPVGFVDPLGLFGSSVSYGADWDGWAEFGMSPRSATGAEVDRMYSDRTQRAIDRIDAARNRYTIQDGSVPLGSSGPTRHVIFWTDVSSTFENSDVPKKVQQEIYAMYGKDAIIESYRIRDIEDFIKNWNKMHTSRSGFLWLNETKHPIETVTITSHGNPISFKNQDGLEIGTDVISRLDAKNINTLLLLLCNSGHLDTSNIAKAFAENGSTNRILAVDGLLEVVGTTKKWSFNVQSGPDFTDYSKGGRSPAGYVVYSSSGNGINTVQTGVRSVESIEGLIKLAQK